MKQISANITGSFILNNVDLTTTIESSSIWSGSIASRVSSLEQFSSSLDATYATDVQLNAVTQSVNTLSSSFLSYTSSTDDKIAQLNRETASLNLATASLYVATASLYAATASLYAATASINSYTSSNNDSITDIRVTTASLYAATASINSYTASNNNNVAALYAATASLYNATASIYGATSSLFSYSASATLRINALDQYTASLNTRSASFACVDSTNNFACAQNFSNTSNAISFTSTGSLYSDGGMRITKDMYVSGTAFFNNVTVFGTQSINYITSSQLNISTNIISVNTDTPAVRFGGLSVYDSGSTGLTGSLLWDSENNKWIYSNPSGSSYDGGMLISGPRNSSGLGNEQGTTACMVMVGQGGDHITSSQIYHSSTITCIGNSKITGNFNVAGNTCLGGGYFYVSTDSTFDTNKSYTFRDAVGIANPNSLSYCSSAVTVLSVGSMTSGNSIITTGNVGIGTMCPSGSLHNFSSGANDNYTYFEGSGAYVHIKGRADYAKLYIDGPSATRWSMGTEAGQNLLFKQADSSTKLTLFTTGEACFASSVCANYFYGATSIVAEGTLWSGGSIRKLNANQCLFFRDAAGNVEATIGGSGNFGINITTPTAKLYVQDSNPSNCFCSIAIFSNNSADRLHIKDEDGTNSNPTGIYSQTGYGTGIYNCSSGASSGVKIFTGAPLVGRFRIDSNGIATFCCQVCVPNIISFNASSAAACITSCSTDYSMYVRNMSSGFPLSIYTNGDSNGVNDDLKALKIARASNDNQFLAVSLIYGGFGYGYKFAPRYYNGASYVCGAPTVIDSYGNIGINCTAPFMPLTVKGCAGIDKLVVNGTCFNSFGEHLQINGCARLFYGQFRVSSGPNDSNYMFLTHDDVNGYLCINRTVYAGNMILAPFGGVGIATSSVTARLTVNSGINTSSANVLALQQATDGTNKDAAAFGLSIQNGGQNTNAADLYISTATGGALCERMRITSTGYVGIGTSSPNISGGLTGNAILTMKATTNSRVAIIELNGCRDSNGDNNSYIMAFNNSCTTPFGMVRFNRGTVDGCGSITLNTSGADRMVVTSGGCINVVGVGNRLNFDTTDGPSTIQLGTTSDYVFRLQNNRGVSTIMDLGNNHIDFYSNGSLRQRIFDYGNVCFACAICAPVVQQPSGFTVYSFPINYGVSFCDVSSGNYLSIGGTEPGTVNNYCAYAHGGISPRVVGANTEGMSWTCLRFVLRALSPGGVASGTPTYLQTAGYFYNTGFYGICTCINIQDIMDGTRGYSTVVLPWIPYSAFTNAGDVTGFGIRNVGPTTVRIGSVFIQYK